MPNGGTVSAWAFRQILGEPFPTLQSKLNRSGSRLLFAFSDPLLTATSFGDNPTDVIIPLRSKNPPESRARRGVETPFYLSVIFRPVVPLSYAALATFSM